MHLQSYQSCLHDLNPIFISMILSVNISSIHKNPRSILFIKYDIIFNTLLSSLLGARAELLLNG